MAGVKRSFATAMIGHDGAPPAISNVTASPARTPPRYRPSMAPTTMPTDSLDSMTRTPSPTYPPLTGEVPQFRPDASIMLVGIRGAGKSTLAIMASSAMKRKVIDMETAFQRAEGYSSANYKKINGSAQCHAQQAKVLQGILDRYRSGCIIVCSWMESRVQGLLRDFAATNPVIHIVRDTEAIQDHLKIRDAAKVASLLNVSSAIFRTCSNFEFFNVSETPAEFPSSPASETMPRSPPAPYLTLKQAERHLLKFLSLIYPSGTIPFIDSAFPLAEIPPEEREFTYILSIPLSDVLSGDLKLKDLVVGADVVSIVLRDLLPDDGQISTPEAVFELMNSLTRGVGIVRRSTILPISIHVILPESTTEDVIRSYLDITAHALRLSPEMVTVDLRLDDSDITRVLSSKRRSKIMATLYLETNPPAWGSPAWVTWYRKAARLGCDMVRLIRPANCIEDNFAISRLRSSVDLLPAPRIPLIAYNSGPLGRNSACFNPVLTVVAPMSSQQLDLRPPTRPIITAQEATRALYSSFIYDTMKMYVIGTDVGYSLSPMMHNGALQACGLPHNYQPFSSHTLRGVHHIIEDEHFAGASIGLPFKVEIITLAHSMSRHAQAIGAVNTLIPVRELNNDGTVPEGAKFFKSVSRAGPVKALYGENTDWIGIRACIRKGLSPANAVRPTTCGLIVGAGGMARAAVYAMLQVGVKNIAIYNRTTRNAEKLVTHFTNLLQRKDFKLLAAGTETRFHVIQDRDDPWPTFLRLPTIIISCIPTHAIDEVPAPDFTAPEVWLGNRTGGVIIELGYKDLSTPLLSQARREAARGWVALDGLDLLPEQGFAQFELFTGRRAPRMTMTRALLSAARDRYDESHQALLDQRLRLATNQDA